LAVASGRTKRRAPPSSITASVNSTSRADAAATRGPFDLASVSDVPVT
jgi:hypothetical protein